VFSKLKDSANSMKKQEKVEAEKKKREDNDNVLYIL